MRSSFWPCGLHVAGSKTAAPNINKPVLAEVSRYLSLSGGRASESFTDSIRWYSFSLDFPSAWEHLLIIAFVYFSKPNSLPPNLLESAMKGSYRKVPMQSLQKDRCLSGGGCVSQPWPYRLFGIN